jgi:phosphatidylglycerophosphatase A
MISDRTLPSGAAFWQPHVLLATWFGSGLLPKAPGTWGSLAAVPFAWAIQREWGGIGLAAAAVVMFLAGWWASSLYVRRRHVADPQEIVVDEVAAQWLVLAVAPPSLAYYALGVALFRIADIVKPFPANWADRRLHGGLGVMGDDMIAGLYAMLILWALAATLG